MAELTTVRLHWMNSYDLHNDKWETLAGDESPTGRPVRVPFSLDTVPYGYWGSGPYLSTTAAMSVSSAPGYLVSCLSSLPSLSGAYSV